MTHPSSRGLNGLLLLAVVSLLLVAFQSAHRSDRDAGATPPQLAAAYSSLADTILAAKQTEWDMVHAILAATYSHAEGTIAHARAKLEAGQDARAEIELLAALVAQLGNEGDATVAGIRKRLIDGGHHHHADDGDSGAYDEGFVIVTRKAKQALLEAAGRIGRLGATRETAALDHEWERVALQFQTLHEGTDH
ncbi:MAG: hypothetical protein ACYTCU_01745 [Planctomycetota bacterium]|jgi:hypothetical protein